MKLKEEHSVGNNILPAMRGKEQYFIRAVKCEVVKLIFLLQYCQARAYLETWLLEM